MKHSITRTATIFHTVTKCVRQFSCFFIVMQSHKLCECAFYAISLEHCDPFASHCVYAEPTVKKRNETEKDEEKQQCTTQRVVIVCNVCIPKTIELTCICQRRKKRKRNYAGNGVPRRKQRPHFAFLLNNKLSNKYQFSIWKIINFQLFPAVRVRVRVYWWISLHSLHTPFTLEHCELWVDAFALFFFFRS